MITVTGRCLCAATGNIRQICVKLCKHTPSNRYKSKQICWISYSAAFGCHKTVLAHNKLPALAETCVQRSTFFQFSWFPCISWNSYLIPKSAILKKIQSISHKERALQSRIPATLEIKQTSQVPSENSQHSTNVLSIHSFIYLSQTEQRMHLVILSVVSMLRKCLGTLRK